MSRCPLTTTTAAALTCCTLFQPYPLNLTSYSGLSPRSMMNHGSQLVVSFVPNGSVLPYLHAPYHKGGLGM